MPLLTGAIELDTHGVRAQHAAQLARAAGVAARHLPGDLVEVGRVAGPSDQDPRELLVDLVNRPALPQRRRRVRELGLDAEELLACHRPPQPTFALG